MSACCLGFFHTSLLVDDCFSEDCRVNRHIDFNTRKANIIKLIACIPLVAAQVIGMVMIEVGSQMIQENQSYSLKVEGIAFILRGLATFFGLGILCLLIDIIVSVSLLIKKTIEKKYCGIGTV